MSILLIITVHTMRETGSQRPINPHRTSARWMKKSDNIGYKEMNRNGHRSGDSRSGNTSGSSGRILAGSGDIRKVGGGTKMGDLAITSDFLGHQTREQPAILRGVVHHGMCIDLIAIATDA